MKAVFITLLLAFFQLNAQAGGEAANEPFAIKGFKLDAPTSQDEKCTTAQVCAAATTILGETFDVHTVYLNSRRAFVMFLPTLNSIPAVETDGYFATLAESITERSRLQPRVKTLSDGSFTKYLIEGLSTESLIDEVARKACAENTDSSALKTCRSVYLAQLSSFESNLRAACGDCNIKVSMYSWPGEGFEIHVVRRELPKIAANMDEFFRRFAGPLNSIQIYHLRADCSKCRELMAQSRLSYRSASDSGLTLEIAERSWSSDSLKNADRSGFVGKRSDL